MGKLYHVIHWGLYSHLANKWKDRTYYGIGEWMMNEGMAGADRNEYMAVAREFNPSEFDAKKIAKLAKEAGMKYIIITSKHHDGFAMYHSACNPFNIVYATPFGRDPIRNSRQPVRQKDWDLVFIIPTTKTGPHRVARAVRAMTPPATRRRSTNISERNAQWYYLRARANYGIGNQVNAMEDAQQAVNMDPNNMVYRQFLSQLQNGGAQWYQSTGESYGYPNTMMNFGNCCMECLMINLCCNCCCGCGRCC